MGSAFGQFTGDGLTNQDSPIDSANRAIKRGYLDMATCGTFACNRFDDVNPLEQGRQQVKSADRA